MEVRRLEQSDYPVMRDVIWGAYSMHVAKDCTYDGNEQFRVDLYDDDWLETIEHYGAFINGELAGVISTRLCDSHITLLFVNDKCNGRGVGRRLVNLIINRCVLPMITVNASIYAHDFYKKMGFVDRGGLREVGGIKHYPMTFNTASW